MGAPDPVQLLTALTTEHFTLQGARSQTMSETSARASVYMFSVSSALVALGFVSQVAGGVGGVFDVFALTVLPTVYVLGCATYVRLVECGAEDLRYGMAINRIRGYYKELADDRADLFLLSGHDDAAGVFAEHGPLARPPEPGLRVLDRHRRGQRRGGRGGGRRWRSVRSPTRRSGWQRSSACSSRRRRSSAGCDTPPASSMPRRARSRPGSRRHRRRGPDN